MSELTVYICDNCHATLDPRHVNVLHSVDPKDHLTPRHFCGRTCYEAYLKASRAGKIEGLYSVRPCILHPNKWDLLNAEGVTIATMHEGGAHAACNLINHLVANQATDAMREIYSLVMQYGGEYLGAGYEIHFSFSEVSHPAIAAALDAKYPRDTKEEEVSHE